MENFQFIGIDVSVLNPTNDPAVDGSDDDSARVAQQSVFFFILGTWGRFSLIFVNCVSKPCPQ